VRTERIENLTHREHRGKARQGRVTGEKTSTRRQEVPALIWNKGRASRMPSLSKEGFCAEWGRRGQVLHVYVLKRPSSAPERRKSHKQQRRRRGKEIRRKDARQGEREKKESSTLSFTSRSFQPAKEGKKRDFSQDNSGPTGNGFQEGGEGTSCCLSFEKSRLQRTAEEKKKRKAREGREGLKFLNPKKCLILGRSSN